MKKVEIVYDLPDVYEPQVDIDQDISHITGKDSTRSSSSMSTVVVGHMEQSNIKIEYNNILCSLSICFELSKYFAIATISTHLQATSFPITF